MALPGSVNRFQRRDYAEIDIVQTEKKGFGLRAATDLCKFVISNVYLYLPQQDS
jgi:[histone H3]-lysine36 N-trimethyltransferase